MIFLLILIQKKILISPDLVREILRIFIPLKRQQKSLFRSFLLRPRDIRDFQSLCSLYKKILRFHHHHNSFVCVLTIIERIRKRLAAQGLKFDYKHAEEFDGSECLREGFKLI